MKTKTIMKILTIVMIVAMLATITMPVFAEAPMPSASGSVPSGLQNAAGQIITIVQFVCFAAAVIMNDLETFWPKSTPRIRIYSPASTS